MNTHNPQPERLAILGGSFNPLHFGHLRLAVEVYEALLPDRLDFVPTARPPHKQDDSLLPFDLRYAMIQATVGDLPFCYVNAIEARRNGPSYTSETLRAYKSEYPGSRLYFILGSEDFLILNSWKDWQALPPMATLTVAARQGGDAGEFAQTVQSFWPGAHEIEPEREAVQKAFALPGGGEIIYLPIPRLDINASLIRSRWLDKRSINFWVPDTVINMLQSQYGAVRRHWLA